MRQAYLVVLLLVGAGLLAVGTVVVRWHQVPGPSTEPPAETKASDPEPAPPFEVESPAASTEARLAIPRFHVVQGLKVDLVAAEPLVVNPVAFCFDERGQIYVAETFRLNAGALDIHGYMDVLDQDLASRTTADRVALIQRRLAAEAATYTRNHDRVRLLHRAGDGRVDRASVFADGFNDVADGLGAGVLARGGRVWYTCIPHLWLLRDTRGRGQADVRQALQSGYGVHISSGGHDLHGLRFGPDGKLYFTIGDRGLNVQAPGHPITCLESGAVLRCNPDGSELEIYATGLRNPQKLAFDQLGNLFTCDNNADFGDLCRWVYVVPGGDSGWRLGYQFLKEPTLAGPWMAERLWEPQPANRAAYLVPPLAGISTGPAGLTYHPGVARLPARYRDHFFLADFGGSSGDSGIHAFANRPQGASFELAETENFWWGVLPTDVEFGPDGALYLTDWVDGFTMPNKGRIYKIEDPSRADDPLVQETTRLIGEGMAHRPVAELAGLLGHPDLRVRQEAQFALAERGEEATKALAEVSRTGKVLLARLHALWGLGQLGRKQPRALEAVAARLGDPDAEVRGQAAKVLGEARWAPAGAEIRGLLQDDNPRVRFLAALALARLARPDAVAPVLLMLRENADQDAYLRHAGVMALAGAGDPKALLAAAGDDSPAVRLGVLLALRRLENPEVARFLSDAEPRLVLEAARAINDVPIPAALPQLAALGIRAGLPEPVLYRVLNANFRLGQPANAAAVAAIAAQAKIPESVRLEALRELGAWGKPPGRDRVLGLWRPLAPRPASHAGNALRPLLGVIFQGPGGVCEEAARAVASLGLKDAGPVLLDLVVNQKGTPGARVEALKALEALADGHLEEAMKRALADREVLVRVEGRRMLARLRPAEAVGELANALEKGMAVEQQGALATLAEMKTPAADQLLARWLDKLRAGQVPAEIELDLLEAAARRGTPELLAKRDAWEAARPKDDPLAPYRECLAGGSAETGRVIFFEKDEVACLRCHKVNGEGGAVGPDLSKIGAKKDRRYLLESVVDPNKQIAEGFETVVLALRNGRTVAGVLNKEDGQQLTLTLPEGQGQVLTVPKAEVETRTRGRSAMPEDLIKKLSKRELRDLVEFMARLK